MIKDARFQSVILFLASVFFASFAQVLLKKSALSEHTSQIREYLNWRVLSGYFIMFGCTVLSVIAYRNMPLSLGMMLETTSYIYVTVFGITVFKEKVNRKKMIALGVIIGGIFLYAF